MPLLGLIPFLRSEEVVEDISNICVNVLTRAYPISTNNTQNTTTSAQCVNALTRAYPISTEEPKDPEPTPEDVSMPLLGLIPFLRYPFQNPLKSMVSGTVFRG